MSERNLQKDQCRHGCQRQDGQDRCGRHRRTTSSIPLYKKIIKRTVKLKAHDENNACGVGDKVEDHGDPPAFQGQETGESSKIIEKAK